jgi:type I restriction-modification system DNA methylase subunit
MIFSHVLYQLSYPGIAAATVLFGPASDKSAAYGEARRMCLARL